MQSIEDESIKHSLQIQVTAMRKNPNYSIYYNSVARLFVLGIIPAAMLIYLNYKVNKTTNMVATVESLRGSVFGPLIFIFFPQVFVLRTEPTVLASVVSWQCKCLLSPNKPTNMLNKTESSIYVLKSPIGPWGHLKVMRGSFKIKKCLKGSSRTSENPEDLLRVLKDTLGSKGSQKVLKCFKEFRNHVSKITKWQIILFSDL